MDGKLVLTGNLKLLSPLHIGSGERESTDLDVIRDSEGKPFITFTSFIGALKHFLKENYTVNSSYMELLFGYSKEIRSGSEETKVESRGSLISGSDFCLPDSQESSQNLFTIRDGIKIDIKTGIVVPGAKYDYEIVDRNTQFNFRIEAAYSSKTDKESESTKLNKETLLQYFYTIIEVLKQKDAVGEQAGLRLGSKTNNGLGKIFLDKEKLMDFDFSKPKNIIAWLKREDADEYKGGIPETLSRNHNDLIIDAYLDLKTSVIQRSYNDDPALPDASHIKSGGEYILTGSGTKGAIVARAKRIINTIWNVNSEKAKIDFINKLFGLVDTENKDSVPIKSKLQIEERILPKYIAELHARIKIDRFTGGTITGALFDSMPLFNTKEISEMKEETDLHKKYTWLTIRIRDCSEAEAGLMLLVLKDIWTGDLAIGGEKGIGRGVFNGAKAFVKYKNEKTVELSKGLENLSSLQKYVDALTEKAGVKNVE